MKIIHTFEPGDRYRYDFNLRSCARGWAQVDTGQDASWFGTWASPSERTILNFAEGDVTRTVCDTDEEFATALREIDRWNREHGYGPARIGPAPVSFRSFASDTRHQGSDHASDGYGSDTQRRVQARCGSHWIVSHGVV